LCSGKERVSPRGEKGRKEENPLLHRLKEEVSLSRPAYRRDGMGRSFWASAGKEGASLSFDITDRKQNEGPRSKRKEKKFAMLERKKKNDRVGSSSPAASLHPLTGKKKKGGKFVRSGPPKGEKRGKEKPCCRSLIPY